MVVFRGRTGTSCLASHWAARAWRGWRHVGSWEMAQLQAKKIYIHIIYNSGQYFGKLHYYNTYMYILFWYNVLCTRQNVYAIDDNVYPQVASHKLAYKQES